MKRGARGGRGGGRGRKAVVPSSPPSPADSPDHQSAPSQVESSDLDPSRTPVHEPRVTEPSSQETLVLEPSSHVTSETSGHADGEETWSDDSFSDGELVEQGKKIYQRGGVKLPAVAATRDQRWLIQPNGEK